MVQQAAQHVCRGPASSGAASTTNAVASGRCVPFRLLGRPNCHRALNWLFLISVSSSVDPAVLTFGLSSEYLKSTREAQAKEKVPDADRSLYR